MKSTRAERLVFLLFGFLPGVFIGGLAVVTYVKFEGGIVHVGPHSFAFNSWIDKFEAPPANYWWALSSYDNNAIHVPLGRIVLVRSKDTLGAIRFTSFDIVNDVAVGHLWLLSDNKSDGTLSVEQEQAFAVWEVQEVVGYKFENGAQQADVRYAGGELYIQLGDLSIEWSQSSWLYFQPGVAFALLNVGDIIDVTPELLGSITVPDSSR